MDRRYYFAFKKHFAEHRQMILLTGPRQVGKTTCARKLASRDCYLNWDNQDHRADILKGPDAVVGTLGLDMLREGAPVVAFDEIHRYGKWKSFVKGFFDTFEQRCRILVTGSSRLDVYKRGGDSLMGRYFPYRMHPLSVAELCSTSAADTVVRPPTRVPDDVMEGLCAFGGFPEPFLKGEKRFYNRWRRLRTEQLLREDLRDLTRIQELDQVEVLAELLRESAGSLLTYQTFANTLNASVDTVKRWVTALSSLYYCFTIRPWFRNVAKAIRKQPKLYLWDWSLVADPGKRLECFVACHLLKAVHWWNDTGMGEYGLWFVRDKNKREVDFLLSRDGKPWVLAEVKSSREALSRGLLHFHAVLGTAHAFQIVAELPYVDADCFEQHAPMCVPARTFLSQLV